MLEAIFLGLVQGIAEWLPVSSEGLIVLIETGIYGNALTEAVRYALFLHVGTVLAALVYYRREVWSVLQDLFTYRSASREAQMRVRFFFIATLVSGVLGLGILKLLEAYEEILAGSNFYINLGIGVLLLFTAYTQLRKHEVGNRGYNDLDCKNGLYAGLAQGFAALPGVSRSGTTVAVLMLLSYRSEDALKVSFIMSIPIVLLGNVALGFSEALISLEGLVALLVSFGAGLFTIHVLVALARRVQFGWFVLGFAILLILGAFASQVML